MQTQDGVQWTLFPRPGPLALNQPPCCVTSPAWLLANITQAQPQSTFCHCLEHSYLVPRPFNFVRKDAREALRRGQGHPRAALQRREVSQEVNVHPWQVAAGRSTPRRASSPRHVGRGSCGLPGCLLHEIKQPVTRVLQGWPAG